MNLLKVLMVLFWLSPCHDPAHHISYCGAFSVPGRLYILWWKWPWYVLLRIYSKDHEAKCQFYMTNVHLKVFWPTVLGAIDLECIKVCRHRFMASLDSGEFISQAVWRFWTCSPSYKDFEQIDLHKSGKIHDRQPESRRCCNWEDFGPHLLPVQAHWTSNWLIDCHHWVYMLQLTTSRR